MKKSEAAQVFQISHNTVDLWLKRQAKTGDLRRLDEDCSILPAVQEKLKVHFLGQVSI
jgi:transposase